MYGCYIGLYVIFAIVNRDNLSKARFRNPQTNEEYEPSFWIIFFYFFTNYEILTFLMIFCAIMGFFVTAFAVYNVLIIRDGVTSNEKSKINRVMTQNSAEFEKAKEIFVNKEKSMEDRSQAQRTIELINKSASVILEQYKVGFTKNMKEIIFD